MWRLVVRNTLARRARLAMTLLAVVLGVAFVTGSLILTDTSRRVLDEQFATAAAGVDLTVRSAAAFDSAMGVPVERDTLPAGVVEKVRAVPGVSDAHPAVKGQGLLTVDGKAIIPGGSSVLESWLQPPMGAFTIKDGRAPAAAGEVVVDAETARRHEIAVGDRIGLSADVALDVTVVGLARFGSRDGLAGSTVALVDLPTAQRLLKLEGATEIAVTAGPGTDVNDLQRRVRSALGPSYDVASSRDLAAAASAAAQNQLGFLQVMLMALAAAGLLVGAFLITNTFSIVVAQRSHELAVLRATGATGRQVLASVLGEALLIGVTASLAGLGAGVAAATGMRRLASAFGIALPQGELNLTGRTVAVALGVGMLVTVVAAIAPARRAARIAPVEAMRRSAVTSRVSRGRAALGLSLTSLGVAGIGTVLTGAGSLALLGLSAAAALAGLTALGPRLIPVISRALGRPLDLLGVAGRLARESATRTPHRTAATAMGLALGLALVSFTVVVATSVKASMNESYSEVITADYVVESARNEMLGGLPSTVHHAVETLPDVAVASRIRYGHWKDGQQTNALTAVDPATLPEVTRLRLTQGRLSALGGGGIILARNVAADRGLSVGDTLSMTFARTGTQHLPVVGLLDDRDAQALSTSYIIGLDTYARHFTEDVDASVLVRLAAGADAEKARTAIEAATADAPTAQVRDQAAAMAGRTATIDQVLGLVTALLLLTIAIALLGITNTLALSIHERVREVGLLRAVGMTRAQLGVMVRSEALLIAALAVIVGVGLGTALAAGTVRSLGAATEAAVVMPVGQLGVIVATALGAGLLAGLLPARRAGKLDVLTAIAHT